MTSNYQNQIFKQLEEVLKKCDNLSEEIIEIKNKHKKEMFELDVKHSKEINKLNDKIDNLERENEKLKEENKLYKNDNDRIKAILNKDSSNSSIPPSKDEKPKKKKINLREKTNKKSGGQKGYKGATFTKKEEKAILNRLKK